MLQAREAAREDYNWADADLLKLKIEQSGWQISDTPNGPKIIKKGK
jgi:cysteinyl-tRNA synthetase